MERESRVLTASVKFDGQKYTASYFIEGGIIHASIEGKSFFSPVGRAAAVDTVKVLLTDYLLQTLPPKPE